MCDDITKRVRDGETFSSFFFLEEFSGIRYNERNNLM